MTQLKRRRILRKAFYTAIGIFAFLNVIAAFHAYKFTHFKAGGHRTAGSNLTASEKMQILLTGIDNPRPVNTVLPARPYHTVIVNSNVKLECWDMPSATQPAKGTVIMFHGYTSNKSALLPRAEALLQNGYDCFVVDFMGSGGSGGNQTTVGYKEADEVRDCYNYLAQHGRTNIHLYGSSMGAVAIMKAMNDHHLKPKSIVIECPFGTMYETVCVRFKMMNAPTFPLAAMLLFWGGVENGFWGFAHNPVTYAHEISCPTLLQYGAKDDRVSKGETEAIYKALGGPKELAIYPLAGHDNFMRVCKNDWTKNMVSFLDKH